jgi:signal transduction histidine kinase
MPLVIVVTSLLVLALAPLVVERQQLGPRTTMEHVADAQIAVNDLQEALAIAGDPSASETSGQVRADVRRLLADTRTFDREAARQAAEIAALVERGAPLPTVYAASRHLEQRLDALAVAMRAKLLDAARWNRIVPAVLVPLALVSVVLVWQVGQRATRDAAAAEASRRAYLRAMQEKATLMRGVTHDLKNPLSAALGYVQLLRDGVYGGDAHGDARGAEPLRRVEGLVQTALVAVSDLLDVARAEAMTHAEPTVAPIDLALLVRALGDDYAASAHAAGLVLDVAAPRDGLVVPTDGRGVRRIVENLLSNAIKYTPTGGAVSLRLTAEPDRCRVTVADTGPGIPPALRERVFDEFYRAPRSAGPGAGIGLASSRQLARSLGGDVAVRARPGGGSVFELWLPHTQTLARSDVSTRHAAPLGRLDGPSPA